MQRGTRLTLAAAILLAGAAAAMMFRREKPASETASLPSVEQSPYKRDAGASTPAPVGPHLTGRIESSEPTHFESPLAALPPPPMTVVPATAVLPGRNNFAFDEPAAQPAAAARTHKVRDGDTLSELARRYLGRRERFMEIFQANRDQLASPDLLPIGKELRIPDSDVSSSGHTPLGSQDTDATSPAPAAVQPGDTASEPTASLGVIRPINGPPRPPRTYRVQNEETLVQVAERVYGNPARYLDLYDANRDRLDSPQNLRPGMILFVP